MRLFPGLAPGGIAAVQPQPVREVCPFLAVAQGINEIEEAIRNPLRPHADQFETLILVERIVRHRRIQTGLEQRILARAGKVRDGMHPVAVGSFGITGRL